ncbi:hypothetical protein ACFFRR_000614 [Megaselia abdita]
MFIISFALITCYLLKITIASTVKDNGTIDCFHDCASKIDFNETYQKIVDHGEQSSSLIKEAETTFKMVLCVLLLIVVLMLCFFWEKTNSYQGGYNPDDTQDDDGE